MIKPIDNELFLVFQKWCDAHGWPQAPRNLYPKRGFMAFIDEKPIIAGWLYIDTDSAYCMMEYVVGNPDSTHDERGEAFHELAQHIFKTASDLGSILMHMAISNDKKTFGKRLETEGFQPTDKNVTLYLKVLTPNKKE